MSAPKFVASTAFPDWMVEKVARVAHSRGCGSFNGERPVAPPRFAGDHRRSDMVRVSINLSDICNALHITPGQIADWTQGGKL